MTRKKAGFDFEQALEQLESVVDDMEAGELSLEDSLKAFENGIKLTRDCQTALSKAEQKVHKLIEKNGQIETEDFDNE